MSETKSWGQRLYEYKNPKYITVYRERTPWAEPMTIPNPAEPAAWEHLTERCKQGWEKSAMGHNMFTAEEQAQQSKEKKEREQANQTLQTHQTLP